MIKNFRSKEAQKIFEGEYSHILPNSIQRIAMRKLWMIHAAISIHDLRTPPSNHLEKLKGRRKGQYSIRINDQWRICFLWKQKDVYDVEITDYHH